MKKILFAAITAGVLRLAAAPVANAKVSVGLAWAIIWAWHKDRPGSPLEQRLEARLAQNRCRMVPVWRNHHQYWVRRCW